MAANPTHQAGPAAIRTHAHASRPTQCRPKRTGSTHPPSPTGKAAHPPAGQYTPPGASVPGRTPAKPPAKSKRLRPGNTRPQAIQHATHARGDQTARTRARKGTARAPASVAGRYAQNFCRFGAKKPLPPALGCVIEGGQKSDKGRKNRGGRYKNPPELHDWQTGGGGLQEILEKDFNFSTT